MNKDILLSQLEGALGSFTNKDPEYLFACPNESCSSRSKGKRKLQVNFEKNVFHCWVCEFKGSSLFYLAKYLGLDTSQFNEEDLSTEIEDELKESEEVFEVKHYITIPSNFQPIYSAKDRSNNYIQAYNYLKKRGLSAFDIIKYKIYYNVDDYQVLTPSFDEDGDVNTYAIRGIHDNFKFLPQFPKLHVIPNDFFIDWEEDIILVEGFFDAYTAGNNAIPLLGSSLNAKFALFQKILQKKPKSVILALDKDAFERKTLRIAKLLHANGITVKIIRFDDDRDVNDIGHEAFQSLLFRAELYHDLYYMEHQLNNL